jgi:chorismate dehydratase
VSARPLPATPGAEPQSAAPGAGRGAPEASPTVARIPYLNAQPFYADWPSLPARSVDLVPRRLGQEARAGAVDAGVMAAADYLTLDREFERVGDLGIACRGQVESVLLLAHEPVTALGGARVMLTAESSTSAALVRLLLETRFGLRGLSFERAATGRPAVLGDGEAWLVIGDSALAARRAAPREVCLDLGAAWGEWTGLPFVYAVWAVRRSLPAETRAELGAFLDASLAHGERDLPGIGRAYAEAHGGALGGPEDLARYLGLFTYRLGAAEEQGLATFHKLLEEFAT